MFGLIYFKFKKKTKFQKGITAFKNVIPFVKVPLAHPQRRYVNSLITYQYFFSIIIEGFYF